jgi:hypothetical protein
LFSKDGESKSVPLLLIPESIGVITAFAGYLTARGSNFWQEHWEALENELRMWLTQVVMCPCALATAAVDFIVTGESRWQNRA